LRKTSSWNINIKQSLLYPLSLYVLYIPDALSFPIAAPQIRLITSLPVHPSDPLFSPSLPDRVRSVLVVWWALRAWRWTGTDTSSPWTTRPAACSSSRPMGSWSPSLVPGGRQTDSSQVGETLLAWSVCGFAVLEQFLCKYLTCTVYCICTRSGHS
jgi:hypothetical protein